MTPKPDDASREVVEITEENAKPLIAAMREADEKHQTSGGGTNHYVRECLLPALKKYDLRVVLDAAPSSRPAPKGTAYLERLIDATERVVLTAEKITERQGDEDVVVGYRHKTGAIHALIGVLRDEQPAPKGVLPPESTIDVQTVTCPRCEKPYVRMLDGYCVCTVTQPAPAAVSEGASRPTHVRVTGPSKAWNSPLPSWWTAGEVYEVVRWEGDNPVCVDDDGSKNVMLCAAWEPSSVSEAGDERAALRDAVLAAAIPLEVLMVSDEEIPYAGFAPTLRLAIKEAVVAIRAALPAARALKREQERGGS